RQRVSRFNVSGHTVYGASYAGSRRRKLLIAFERDRHIIGRCYLDRVVYQSGITKTLNSPTSKVDDKTHRNGLLLVWRRAPSRRPLTCERERRWLLRQSSHGEAALHELIESAYSA